MAEAFPPTSCEDLIRVIHDRYDNLSKSYHKIARNLIQNPSDVAAPLPPPTPKFSPAPTPVLWACPPMPSPKAPKRARRRVAQLKAGMVGINSFAMAAAEAPFGGTNHSGIGREGGTEAIRDDLEVKFSQMVWA